MDRLGTINWELRPLFFHELILITIFLLLQILSKRNLAPFGHIYPLNGPYAGDINSSQAKVAQLVW